MVSTPAQRDRTGARAGRTLPPWPALEQLDVDISVVGLLAGGADIEIRTADLRELQVSRKLGREELPKKLRAFRGRLPADFKFDRDEAHTR